MKKKRIRITDRRRRILEFIKGYTEYLGYSPSYREICAAVGISSTSVLAYNLSQLEKAGLIEREPGVIRSITAVEEPPEQNWVIAYIETNPKPIRNHQHTRNSQSGKCIYCGRSDLPIENDHFYPVALGGNDGTSNIVPACIECNQRKRASDPVKWVLEAFGPAKLSEIISFLHGPEPE